MLKIAKNLNRKAREKKNSMVFIGIIFEVLLQFLSSCIFNDFKTKRKLITTLGI